MRLNPHKRGDSFVLTLELFDYNDVPLTLDVDSLKSQVRAKNNRLIDEVLITQTETAGLYIFQVQDTTEWPIADLYMDVKIIKTDGISSTDTLVIPVVRDITRVGE